MTLLCQNPNFSRSGNSSRTKTRTRVTRFSDFTYEFTWSRVTRELVRAKIRMYQSSYRTSRIQLNSNENSNSNLIQARMFGSSSSDVQSGIRVAVLNSNTLLPVPGTRVYRSSNSNTQVPEFDPQLLHMCHKN